jgi:hypothetical protein
MFHGLLARDSAPNPNAMNFHNDVFAPVPSYAPTLTRGPCGANRFFASLVLRPNPERTACSFT